MRILFSISFFLFMATSAFASERDPSGDIQVITLENGLRTVFAPSDTAKTVQVLVRVNAGRWTEETAGIAHLLEHYVFKDAKMDSDMTYLEMIKENGGSGNAHVNDEETAYYATVPADKGPWLLQTFGQLLIGKQFVEEEVEFAKKPVYLEIGQPNPLHYAAAFMGWMLPSIDFLPDLWKREFGFKSGRDKSSTPDQITTASLSAKDLEKFYQAYYHGRNMKLFIAGKFDVNSMASQVRQAFGKLPRGDQQGYKPTDLKARVRNYIRSTSTSGTPTIELGTKVADIGLEDLIAVSVYLQHVSHRLMKEIRNSRGETYSVQPELDIRQRNGFATLSFEAPPEAYYKNLKMVRDLLENEARQGQISEEQFREARELYSKIFDLTERDSDQMMTLAKAAEKAFDEYGSEVRTPFQIVSSMTLDGYKATLKKVFADNMRVEKLNEPPLFFRYEEMLLFVLGLFASIALARKLFLKTFDHRKIRWVRKLAYPPFYLGHFGIFLIALILNFFTGLSMIYLWDEIPFVHSSFLVGDYFFSFTTTLLTVSQFQIVYVLFGRKAMIVGNELWIKSFGYYSWTIPLSEIQSLRLVNPSLVCLDPKMLWKIKYRIFTYDFAFWRPAVLVEISDGRAYLVGVKSPHNALEDLQEYIKKPQGPLEAAA